MYAVLSTGGSSNTGFGVVTPLFPYLGCVYLCIYLFNGDNYYKPLSKAEWHVNAGEYGTNYPKDFQKFGDLVAESRLQAAGGMDETQGILVIIIG